MPSFVRFFSNFFTMNFFPAHAVPYILVIVYQLDTLWQRFLGYERRRHIHAV